MNNSCQASEVAGTKQLSELIEVHCEDNCCLFSYLFNIFDVQVVGPADVTTTSGMPDAERKERQVLCFQNTFHIEISLLLR